jgi:hypothetical protein
MQNEGDVQETLVIASVPSMLRGAAQDKVRGGGCVPVDDVWAGVVGWAGVVRWLPLADVT